MSPKISKTGVSTTSSSSSHEDSSSDNRNSTPTSRLHVEKSFEKAMNLLHNKRHTVLNRKTSVTPQQTHKAPNRISEYGGP